MHIGDWVPAGYLTDVTTLIGDHPQLENGIDTLWGAVEFGGSRWGVPQDAEARLIYYSKILLAELGWTDDEIEGLDERINSGDFTFQDMLATAAEAVEAGVVEEDFGWWHRPVNDPDFLYYYYYYYAGGGGELTEGDNITFNRQAAQNVYELFESATQELNVTPDDKLDGEWDLFKEVTSTHSIYLFVAFVGIAALGGLLVAVLRRSQVGVSQSTLLMIAGTTAFGVVVAKLENTHDIADDAGVELESRSGLQLSLIGVALLVAAGFVGYRARA